MLAGVKIVTTYEHAAGGSLSERAVSTPGEGAPNTILLDGVAHLTKIGGRDGGARRRAAPSKAVRIETTLPGGAGHVVDERRVLGGGELERTIELTLEWQAAAHLHRLLVRTQESVAPQRWPVPNRRRRPAIMPRAAAAPPPTGRRWRCPPRSRRR